MKDKVIDILMDSLEKVKKKFDEAIQNDQPFEASTYGGQLTEMRIHTVNGPSAESYNDIDKTEVGITVSEWVPFDGKVTLEPHSVNVIELK